MRVRRDELTFVENYLDALKGKGTGEEQISDARELLNALKVHDHE